MKSQWFKYKERAIELRKQGFSYGEIVQTLSVPKSTLSHWLRDVELTEQQKQRLNQNYGNGLIKARAKSIVTRQVQKEVRLQKAKSDAEQLLQQIKIDDNLVELALAMLYLGEGAKNSTTAIGNTNPLILKFFLKVLIEKYRIDPSKIHFDLHIRADQDPDLLKKYWSKELNIPMAYFKYVAADRRTEGKASYPDYKGVCVINCGNIAIQRKLVYLYNLFCQEVIDTWTVGAVG